MIFDLMALTMSHYVVVRVMQVKEVKIWLIG